MFQIYTIPTRYNEIKQVFNTTYLDKIWQKFVRADLRSLPLFDLHDFYDFHLYRKEKIDKIVKTILDGTFQPSRTIRIRIEKNHGISRHRVILCPEDAIVLEAMGQYLYKYVDSAKVSDKAFFSRKHPQPTSVEELTTDNSYAWWELWPVFQEKICNFSKSYKYVVTTDVATYYDNISMTLLRNNLASTGQFTDTFLNFVFFMLEHFSWRPDYLPYSGVGLPQISIEATRVLGHVYLFDIDKFLDEKTSGNFVRWMDDIDFGCNSKHEAKKILQDLDAILLSKGLHLNSSKTRILDEESFETYFHFKENLNLNILNSITLTKKTNKSKYYKQIRKIKKSFFVFMKKEKSGNFEKILKRYINLHLKFKIQSIEKHFLSFLTGHPSLRDAIFKYIYKSGWSDILMLTLTEYTKNVTDDSSLLSTIKVLVEWTPVNPTLYRNELIQLAKVLLNKKDSQTHFLCALWIFCKFAHQRDLDKLVIQHSPKWRKSPWIARQIAATIPLLSDKTANNIKNIIYKSGLLEARSVLDNYEKIKSNEGDILKRINPYITALNKNKNYPIHKILIIKSLLNGGYNLNNNEVLKLNIEKCKDIRYKCILKQTTKHI